MILEETILFSIDNVLSLELTSPHDRPRINRLYPHPWPTPNTGHGLGE